MRCLVLLLLIGSMRVGLEPRAFDPQASEFAESYIHDFPSRLGELLSRRVGKLKHAASEPRGPGPADPPSGLRLRLSAAAVGACRQQ